MTGAILGDIIGSVYEHNNIKTKDFDFYTNHCMFTDDTVMTVAVAKALMNFEDVTTENVDEFKEYLIDTMHEIGRRYPDCGYGTMFYFWIIRKIREPYNSFGNGSAMRVSPVGWYAKKLEQAMLIAKATAEVTHNHPEGIKGAVVTAGAVFLARTGASMEEIKEFVSEYYTIDFTVDEIRPTYKFDVTCQGTVPQAMQCFFESSDYEDAIRNAVSIGGDSDTLAAITGAVAHAFYGTDEDMKENAHYYLDDLLLGITLDFEEKYLI